MGWILRPRAAWGGGVSPEELQCPHPGSDIYASYSTAAPECFNHPWEEVRQSSSQAGSRAVAGGWDEGSGAEWRVQDSQYGHECSSERECSSDP